jgi:hypothetical protein
MLNTFIDPFLYVSPSPFPSPSKDCVIINSRQEIKAYSSAVCKLDRGQRGG